MGNHWQLGKTIPPPCALYYVRMKLTIVAQYYMPHRLAEVLLKRKIPQMSKVMHLRNAKGTVTDI